VARFTKIIGSVGNKVMRLAGAPGRVRRGKDTLGREANGRSRDKTHKTKKDPGLGAAFNQKDASTRGKFGGIYPELTEKKVNLGCPGKEENNCKPANVRGKREKSSGKNCICQRKRGAYC